MILMYHKVDIITPTIWWVTPDDLDRHLGALQQRKFVYLDEYQEGKDHVVVTFDDAYENVYRHALPILRRHRVPFEVFVTSNLIGHWNDFDEGEPRTRHMNFHHLTDVVASGGRLQWHTRSHRNLTSLTDTETKLEMDVPEELRSQFPIPHFTWLSYPGGQHNERVVDIARRRFSGAVSVISGKAGDRWQLNRVTMDRFTSLPSEARSVVHRAGMKLFVCIYDDARLLPHFLHHYSACGVSEFHIAAPKHLAAYVANYGPTYKIVQYNDVDVADSFTGGTTAVSEMRRQAQGPEEWAVIVDLDEFVEFPRNASELVDAAEREGANVVRGLLYDRFAESGQPTGFDDHSDLWKVFPIRGRFRKRVMGSDEEYKGVLVKGHLKGGGGGGHHFFQDERLYSSMLDISHFSWSDRSLARCAAAHQRLLNAGRHWHVEYKAALDHYEKHGRFAWETFGGEFAGRRSQFQPGAASRKDFRVIALLSAYNEGDIISQVIGHLVEQGIEVYLLDNHSTDDTFVQARQWLGKGLINIEKFPSTGPEPQFDWTAILRRKEQLAAELSADWFIHHDADEIRESPWIDLSLAKGLEVVDSLGYNCVDFHVLNFRPTDDGFKQGDDPKSYFQFFEEGAAFDKVQLKCWKRRDKSVSLAESAGHEVGFPERRVFPLKFLLRHYPIRSREHGARKIFAERKDRLLKRERDLQWHVQYDGFKAPGDVQLWASARLQRFDAAQVRSDLIRSQTMSVLEEASAPHLLAGAAEAWTQGDMELALRRFWLAFNRDRKSPEALKGLAGFLLVWLSTLRHERSSPESLQDALMAFVSLEPDNEWAVLSLVRSLSESIRERCVRFLVNEAAGWSENIRGKAMEIVDCRVKDSALREQLLSEFAASRPKNLTTFSHWSVPHGGSIDLATTKLIWSDSAPNDWQLMELSDPNLSNRTVAVTFEARPCATCNSCLYINKWGGKDVAIIERDGTIKSKSADARVRTIHLPEGWLRATVEYEVDWGFIGVGTWAGSGRYAGSGSPQYEFRVLSVAPMSGSDSAPMTIDQPSAATTDQRAQPYIAVDLVDPDSDRSAVKRFGIDPAFIVDASRIDSDHEEELFDEFVKHEGLVSGNERRKSTPAELVDLKRFVGLSRAHYVETIFAAGGMLARDLVTGKVLRSVRSLLLDRHHIAYHFAGNVDFFVIVGRWRGEKICLVAPSLDLIVRFPYLERSEAERQWTLGLLESIKRLPPNPNDPAISGNRDVVVAIGLGGNLGHFIWQELAGLEEMISQYGPERITSVLVGRHAALDVAKLFPELPGPKIHMISSDDPAILYQASVTFPGHIVRPVGQTIRKTLRTRIIEAAMGELDHHISEKIRQASSKHQLVWINLRAHNKCWSSQVPGTIAMTIALKAKFPRIALVLDGWADTREIVDAIKNGLPSDVVVFDTVGCKLAESIVWANSISAFCSVVGSGLVLNSWIASKPGFAHGNSAHLSQARFWNLVTEDATKVTFLQPDQVSNSTDMYGNYEFDWKIAADHLTNVLAAP